ncbi:RNA-directed DNA polymerase from mobile element jockey [Trichonephila clavipes]|nr:RNA-directed DNA polymerase from mobile element jockey [Trichonephila clavipes]
MLDIPAGTQAGQTQMVIFCAIGPLGRHWIFLPDTPTHFNSRHSNAILDIGFAVNLSHTEVFTMNTLSSDHNPVIFDFVTDNVLPPILRTLKTTNWIKFQEIIYHTIPGNPRIDDLDLAVQKFYQQYFECYFCFHFHQINYHSTPPPP